MRRRILVIDDEEDFLLVMRIVLELAGHEVVLADSGAEGLRRFAEGGFDAVFLDVSMPDIDGWHVLETIRRTAGDDVPVIMVSGIVRGQPQRWPLHHQAFLLKPLASADVYRALELATS